MLGLLVSVRTPYEPLQPSLPLLPGFVRRVLAAWFRRH
jgi:hypothetical protein